MAKISRLFEDVRGVPILHDFIAKDWPRFQAFWLRGIWRFLPFAVVTRKRLLNMHWDTADHAMYFHKRRLVEEVKRIETEVSSKDSTKNG